MPSSFVIRSGGVQILKTSDLLIEFWYLHVVIQSTVCDCKKRIQTRYNHMPNHQCVLVLYCSLDNQNAPREWCRRQENVLVSSIVLPTNETITLLPNVIGYHQLGLSTKRTLYSSCLCNWTLCIMYACYCHTFRRVNCCFLWNRIPHGYFFYPILLCIID